jgi:hypothetical protein
LVDQFLNAGGKFIAPTDDDVRALVALQMMAQRELPGFDAWLRNRKPLFNTSVFKAAGLCPPPFLAAPPPPAPGNDKLRATNPTLDESPLRPPPPSAHTAGSCHAAKPTVIQGSGGPPPGMTRSSPAPARDQPSAGGRLIPIGRRFERGTLGEAVTLPADLLPRHVAILAGSGSGKTVLLRRMVEEAALLGIPAVVLDVNNDLSRLGEPWPELPVGLSDDDAARAASFHARADVIIWTPGVTSGNPISLNLLPDFAAIGDKQDAQTEDERAQAVEMARATLAPYLGGGGQKALLKQGVLADALRAFAKNSASGSIAELIDLLGDLPDGVSKIGDASKLGNEIANQLLAAIATIPLLQSVGSSLDPQRLFHSRDGRSRISVINLSGLASDEARQSFVNQLQMALFTWIKQHPSPTGRLYVLDEAQNFAPSQTGTACKASALSLVAQARKYGLGMIFATQLPKGIDHTIVTNCTTHVYGRMSSPATIQATQELMAAKGGAADDIARLTRGEFYSTSRPQ